MLKLFLHLTNQYVKGTYMLINTLSKIIFALFTKVYALDIHCLPEILAPYTSSSS